MTSRSRPSGSPAEVRPSRISRSPRLRRLAGWGVTALLSALLVLASAPLAAQDVLRMTVTRPQIVRLGSDAAAIFVANDTLIDAQLINPRTVVLLPIDAGATSLMVLDEGGRTVYAADIVIGGRTPSTVQVTRVCPTATGQCPPSTAHFCPSREECVQLPGATGLKADGEEAAALPLPSLGGGTPLVPPPAPSLPTAPSLGLNGLAPANPGFGPATPTPGVTP